MAKRVGSDTSNDLLKKLIENTVHLQKVQTDLTEKFDTLSKNISSLLTLFESAARTFNANPANQVTEKDAEFLDKINKLLDQNKVIAKGLTLMEDKMREKVYGIVPQHSPNAQEIERKDDYQPSTGSRPLPKF